MKLIILISVLFIGYICALSVNFSAKVSTDNKGLISVEVNCTAGYNVKANITVSRTKDKSPFYTYNSKKGVPDLRRDFKGLSNITITGKPPGAFTINNATQDTFGVYNCTLSVNGQNITLTKDVKSKDNDKSKDDKSKDDKPKDDKSKDDKPKDDKSKDDKPKDDKSKDDKPKDDKSKDGKSSASSLSSHLFLPISLIMLSMFK